MTFLSDLLLKECELKQLEFFEFSRQNERSFALRSLNNVNKVSRIFRDFESKIRFFVALLL